MRVAYPWFHKAQSTEKTLPSGCFTYLRTRLIVKSTMKSFLVVSELIFVQSSWSKVQRRLFYWFLYSSLLWVYGPKYKDYRHIHTKTTFLLVFIFIFVKGPKYKDYFACGFYTHLRSRFMVKSTKTTLLLVSILTFVQVSWSKVQRRLC
jgi:hypothetical protein